MLKTAFHYNTILQCNFNFFSWMLGKNTLTYASITPKRVHKFHLILRRHWPLERINEAIRHSHLDELSWLNSIFYTDYISLYKQLFNWCLNNSRVRSFHYSLDPDHGRPLHRQDMFIDNRCWSFLLGFVKCKREKTENVFFSFWQSYSWSQVFLILIYHLFL